jgi:MauM/NapG family ferredoxin protein
LDPITIVYRTVAVAAWPAINAVFWEAEQVLYALPPLRGAVDFVERTARGVVLPATPPAYGQALVVAIVFAGIAALNAVRPRFWCRYLCPLGALLGLIGKTAWLRRTVAGRCTDCLRCARACPVGTIDSHRGFASDPSECTMCLECVPVCPKDGQQFTWHRQPASWRAYDPSRRQFLASLGTAVATVGLLGIEPAARRESERLIRPPGARTPEFLSQCVRCVLCIKVCPTSGLQPSLRDAGWVGFWTPVLVPRIGYCDFSCNACGQICPTGAIPPLLLPEKRRIVIGVAYIDRDRCLPWADARTCLVCEEMCPLPDKAIRLEEVAVSKPSGAVVQIKRPHVLRDLCTGCGICEHRCPIAGESAIRISAPADLLPRL